MKDMRKITNGGRWMACIQRQDHRRDILPVPIRTGDGVELYGDGYGYQVAEEILHNIFG